MSFRYIICLLSIPFLTIGADREALNYFENKVRPLLSAECYDCHGPEKSKGSLRLDHISYILKGGDSGAALVAGDPANSLMIEAVHRADPDFSMPPKKAISADQIKVLETWIKSGAPWPEEKVKAGEIDQFGFTKEDYQWWAIQPVADPIPPQTAKSWAKNGIDQFISRKLEQHQIKPAPQASRIELVRRAYLDLHGLPPTPGQVNDFLNDEREDAWERLIDQLLDSKAYGERWAQHWLDVVRYSESDGYRADGYRKGTWKYRDYVIKSLNDDKPYDQFVREQLAGDEINPNDPDTMIATAFLRLGIYEWNQRNARMQWDLIMTEMTNITGDAFLGIGIGCAQCHDHKFDPILQKDHFALQAFLNTVWWPENHPVGRVEDLKKQEEWERATEDIRSQILQVKKSKLDSNLKSVVKQFPDDVQKIYHKPREQRTAYEEQLAQLVQRQVDEKNGKVKWDEDLKKKPDVYERYKNLTAELARFDHLKPEKLEFGFISTDVKPVPAKTFIEERGTKNPVEPAFLTLLGLPAPKIQPKGNTTGRRTALANWIASKDNPLSTRVITNRIWQYHFANGLARSPNDFGQLGGLPTHPELLDWLTSRFLDNGWSIKSLHRLIMTSATYQQTSRREPTSVERLADPTNELLWRYPPKRLQAEQVRDSMLAVSGELNRQSGGPSVLPASTRRAVYTQKKRNSPDQFLASFDAPAGFGSTPNRVATTTPNQSLLLVNGPWPMARAKAFARRILGAKNKIEADAIKTAYQSVYHRDPTGEEISAAISFITGQMGKVTPVVAAPKYPDQNGLRDINQYFGKVKSVDLGAKSLWLQPGSRFERLDFSKVDLPTDTFTIEAIANLDSIHKDASVNTLVSKWNGSGTGEGWSFGVTSEKSRYQPRNLIMQLVGDDFNNNPFYEVVASDLRFPLRSPVYIAAAVSAKPTDGDATSGKVTFYMKDLSSPDAKMQVSEIKHSVVGGFTKQTFKSLIGGRDGSGHLWDGQLARLAISHGILSEEDLFINGGKPVKPVIDWDFSDGNGEEPEKGTSWYRKAVLQKSDSKLLSATTDFCHMLFNSNEFLYLH